MWDGRTNEGRGQLIIIGALSLAIILVGIVLVLNSAIYAENLSTRQNDVSSDILNFQSAAVDGVGGAIESTNRDGAGESFATLQDTRYEPRIQGLAEGLANRRSLNGVAVDLETASARPGTQLIDSNASSQLTPRNATATPGDWTMVTAAHVRAFKLTAEPTASNSTSEVVDQLTGGTGEAFEVTLTPASGPVHQVAVYKDSDDGTVRVAIREAGSSTVRECNAEGPAATVSLTGRPTIDGRYCDALDPVADASGLYNVTVTNGDQAVGTYRLVIDRTDGPSASEASLDEQVDRANYGVACSGTTYTDVVGDSPYSVPAIYAATVDLRYRSQRAKTESTVRVAPHQAGETLETPLVTSLSVTDSSGSGNAFFTVDWTVEDPNGDLSEVTVTAENTNDTDSQTDSTTVSGASASGSFSFTDSGDEGDQYDLTVTVSDGTRDRSRTVTHIADGESTSGCPV